MTETEKGVKKEEKAKAEKEKVIEEMVNDICKVKEKINEFKAQSSF